MLQSYLIHDIISKFEVKISKISQVREKRRRDGLHSTLEIQTSIASDFGEYNCSVKNSHGSASLMIILKPESKLKIKYYIIIAFK